MKREQLEQILAEQLIELPIGERLPTVRELADKYDVSVGAIQNALTMIKDKDMVRLDYRGWKGTTLGAKNVSLLWNMAARGEPLVVALPLPSTLICEGLATAIKTLFSAAGIEVFMIFVRGSRYRIRALREKRCHIVVISSFSAREMCEPSEMTVLELPAHTHMSKNIAYFIRNLRQPSQENCGWLLTVTRLICSGLLRWNLKEVRLNLSPQPIRNMPGSWPKDAPTQRFGILMRRDYEYHLRCKIAHYLTE